MRTFGKWLGRLLVALILAVVVMGVWKREEIMRLLAVNSLFSEDKIISNFSHMNDAFFSVDVSRGGRATTDLPYGPDTTLPAQVGKWIEDRDVTALVVLKDGQIKQVADDLGIGLSTLTRWKRLHHESELLAGPHDDVEQELARLRRENELLRQERDLLKKATAFFARETSR